MHWFVLTNQSALGAAIREMRERYPKAPDSPPATEKQILSKTYYTWVFKTVVGDREILREILLGNGIVLP